MEITYNWVFGVEPGEPVDLGQSRNYRPCNAVTALTNILHDIPEFHGGKVQGRSGYLDEFNRHHAGLAIDIMFPPTNIPQVTLGENLFKLFIDHQSIMQWRGMVYQHVSVSSFGHSSNYGRADPMNHIHIDWHNSRNVTWAENITQIPLARGGVVQRTVTPRQINKVARIIRWTLQSETDFQHDATLIPALDNLMQRFRTNQLQRVNTMQSAGLAAPTL